MEQRQAPSDVLQTGEDPSPSHQLLPDTGAVNGQTASQPIQQTLTNEEDIPLSFKIQKLEDAIRDSSTVFEDLRRYLGTISPSKLEALRKENQDLKITNQALLNLISQISTTDETQVAMVDPLFSASNPQLAIRPACPGEKILNWTSSPVRNARVFW